MILNKKKIILFLIIFTYFSFILGFILNENSAGAGSYDGDISWIWKNIQIFENNNLIQAINHPDFFGNRTPLSYILHKYLNPFVHNYENFRISVLSLSLFGPIIFYFILKNNFPDIDRNLLFLISSILLLSPYYRTTAFWGLDENYALISTLLSFLFLKFYINNLNKNEVLTYIHLSITILFSSLCVYFDQKFLLIPIICFFKIISSNPNPKRLIFTIVTYFTFAIPFVFLIIHWKGIVPPDTQFANPNTITSFSRLDKLWYPHIGYATTIIAFYLFPLLFFKDKNILIVVKDLFINKINYLFLFLFFIYLIYLINFFDFIEFTTIKYWIGLGYIHKVSLILFDNFLFQEIFTYFAFFISWLIILIYLEGNLKDFLIILYFYFISLLLWPLMQEYFDPFIILLGFIIFKAKIYINLKNTTFLVFYLSTFLISANFYYFIKLT